MNILMITEKDAANGSLVRVANELISQGHIVKLYATYLDDKTLKSFEDAIQKFPINELSQDDIDWCDIIFCSTLASIYLPYIVFAAKKPIFTHNYLMNRQINWGGDICFAPTQEVVESDYDQYLNYAYIGIGEPKYDANKKVTANSSKRFLFIDSGHYPFSDIGKKELAKTLLYICDKYPDYELVIKPRVLPGDKVITHRNSLHIYDVIKDMCKDNLPSNLVMLERHIDLRELIDSASTVICMYTTAFVGAVVAGKGLVVLENLPTTDVYDIRHKTYMRNRENMLASGALIDYREVDKLLPYGAKGDKSYLDFLLEEKDNVAKKIVEVCTYLYDAFYVNGKFPTIRDSVYSKFKDDFVEDPHITWEKIISQRFHDYMILKSMILIDFHVKAKLDISYVLKQVKKAINDRGIIDEAKFKNFLENVNDIRDKCIIENRELMLTDDIDAGILLNAYYLQKKYDEIRKFPIRDISAFDMYRAFVAVEAEKDFVKAKEHLVMFFDKCGDRPFNLEISDMSNNKFKAFEILINILRKDEEVEKVKFYNEKLKKFYREIYAEKVLEEPVDLRQKEHFIFIKDTDLWLKESK